MRHRIVRIVAALALGVAGGIGLGVGTCLATCGNQLPDWVPPGPITDGPPPKECNDAPTTYTCLTDYQKPGHHKVCEGASSVPNWCCNNTACYWIVYPPKCNGGTCSTEPATQGAPFPCGAVQGCTDETTEETPENCVND